MSLPACVDLNADLGHVVHDRHKIGVRVVDGNDAARTDVAIKPAVRLLEEFPPHLRLHEQSVLGAPVVVREDHVRLQIVDEQLHVQQPIRGDVVNERVHLLRVLIQVRQRVLKAHQEVALLKNACAHEAGEELALGVRGGARARR